MEKENVFPWSQPRMKNCVAMFKNTLFINFYIQLCNCAKNVKESTSLYANTVKISKILAKNLLKKTQNISIANTF